MKISVEVLFNVYYEMDDDERVIQVIAKSPEHAWLVGDKLINPHGVIIGVKETGTVFLDIESPLDGNSDDRRAESSDRGEEASADSARRSGSDTDL